MYICPCYTAKTVVKSLFTLHCGGGDGAKPEALLWHTPM